MKSKVPCFSAIFTCLYSDALQCRVGGNGSWNVINPVWISAPPATAEQPWKSHFTSLGLCMLLRKIIVLYMIVGKIKVDPFLTQMPGIDLGPDK